MRRIYARSLAVLFAVVLLVTAGVSASATTPSWWSAGYMRATWGTDLSTTGYETQFAKGFNVIQGSAFKSVIDPPFASHGLRSLVWLGQWYNAAGTGHTACSWENSDSWITSHVTALAGDNAVFEYYLGDEPDYSDCPTTVLQAYHARVALIHSLDPGRGVMTTLKITDHGGETTPYYHWKGVVDVLAPDVYPCHNNKDGTAAPCDYTKIDAAVTALWTDTRCSPYVCQSPVDSYIAILQDFQDVASPHYYRLPTTAELQAQMDRWDNDAITQSGSTGARPYSGYGVFSWNFGGNTNYNLDNYATSLTQWCSINKAHLAVWPPSC